MRVLQIIRNRRHGGPAQHVRVLTQELAADLDVVVACQPGSWIALELRRAGLPTVEVKLPGSILNPFAAARLTTYARKRGFDVVHGHGDLCALYAILAARRPGARAVATVHSLEPRTVRWSRRCAAIIAVSEATARVLSARGVPGSKLCVVRHGVPSEMLAMDRDECRRRIRGELGVDSSAPLAVAVGKAGWIKGHDLFFEAAALVRGRVPGARFLLLGSGSADFSPKLEQIIAARGLCDAAIFTGHRYDAPEVMAAADVVVLPSRSESLSQTAIEAQAVGTPVVASNVGGLPEVVADARTGIIVDSENVPALAEAMIELFLDSSLARRFGEAGRSRVEAKFLARTMAERTQAVYREVTSQ